MEELITNKNMSLVMNCIFKSEKISRSEIAKELGLTKASLTEIVKKLLDTGLIHETQYQAGKIGHPKMGLELDGDNYVILGIRLNRDYIKAIVCSLHGRELYYKSEEIMRTDGAEIVLGRIKEAAADCIVRFKDKRILGIGIAVPGPFNSETNKIILMSGFEGWENIDLKKRLEDEFKLPVIVEHDAVCGALNEYYYGSHAESKVLAYVATDVGIGAGIVAKGLPFKGAMGAAGEFGHTCIDINGPRCVCGNFGCLEGYCSTENLRKASGGQKDAESILYEIKEGDGEYISIFNRMCDYLGVGLVNFINIVNPDTLIITDNIAIPGKKTFERLDKVLAERLLPEIYNNTKLIVKPQDKDYILFGACALVVGELIINKQF